MGSTCDARNAGTTLATNATMARSAVAAANETGSAGFKGGQVVNA